MVNLPNCMNPRLQVLYADRQEGVSRPYRGPHDLRRYKVQTRYQRSAIAGHAKANYLAAFSKAWVRTEFARGVFVAALLSAYFQAAAEVFRP